MPTVAVVGASSDRGKFGNKAVRAYLNQGWTVHPVNPRGGTIEGLTAIRELDELPGAVDRVLFYVPPEIGLGLVEQVAALEGSPQVFLNPGSESDALVSRSRELGLEPLLDCAIVDVGESPASYGR